MSSVDVESRTLPQFVEQGEPGVTRIACAAGSAMAAALKVVTRRNMIVGGGDPIQPFLTFDCQPKLKMREWGARRRSRGFTWILGGRVSLRAWTTGHRRLAAAAMGILLTTYARVSR